MIGPRKLVILQWIGVMVAPFAWYGQHVIGQAIGQARCSVANAQWGVSHDGWQIGLMAVAGSLVILSEIAAVLCYLGTRKGTYHDPPPTGRFQMFAVAAMCTNFIFLAILILDGVASIVDFSCRNS